MSSTQPQADQSQAIHLLHHWLSRRLSKDALAWLDDKRRRVTEGAPERIFFTAFSAVPRYLSKGSLCLSQQDLHEAEAARAAWQPNNWSNDQAARALLVLALPSHDTDAYSETLDRVFSNADLGESIALYQSLPLLAHPQRHPVRAAEGIRTNMTSVFNAVALRNPYPADYLDDAAWNQMVLKAVFVESPLHLIHGIDRRVNATLARMLTDYAHERWAARRPVTPELWRPVGPYAGDETVDDLKKVLQDPDPIQQEAAALALSQSPSPRAREVLSSRPDLQSSIAGGRLTWSSFSRERLAIS